MDDGSGEVTTAARSDARFAAVAGGYAAALVAPTLALFPTPWLDTGRALVVLGVLVVGVAAATAAVVRRWTDLPFWLSSTRLSWLTPAVGGTPAFLYLGAVVPLVGGSLVTGSERAVGAAGFVLGLVAAGLGALLVWMAGNRPAEPQRPETADASWTAAWPRRYRTAVRWGVPAAVVVVLGTAAVPLAVLSTFEVLVFGAVLGVALDDLDAPVRYRVTPSGLERRLGGVRWLVPWERFEGFGVGDGAVVLYRPFPNADVRCSRTDVLEAEDPVIDALAAYLDRRD